MPKPVELLARVGKSTDIVRKPFRSLIVQQLSQTFSHAEKMTSSLSAGAAIFVPKSLQSVATAGDQDDSKAMTAVRSAMSSLTASPGSYHEVMPKLASSLKNSCKTNDDMKAVVSYIFNLVCTFLNQLDLQV